MSAILNGNHVQTLTADLPLFGDYDVIVAGGGLGGVAATIAAARAGVRTLLVERNAFLGGVATAGMCCSIMNCYHTGAGVLATQGIAVEIADALAEATGYGRRWRRHRGHVIYDIERAKLVLQQLVEDAGADILMQTPIIDVAMTETTVRGVVIHTKTGPRAIRAQAVVDATGDADIAAAAGAPLRRVEKGVHSLCFRLGNVDVDSFVGYFREHPEEFPEHMDVDWTLADALAQYEDCGTFLFPHGGGMQMDAFRRARDAGHLPASVGIQDTTDACQMHALRQTGIVHVITGFTHFDGLAAAGITRSIMDGRRMAFVVAEVYRKYLPGFATCYVAGTAANLGVRVSRCLDGDFVFTPAHMGADVRQPDAVGRAVGYDQVVKHPGAGAWAAFVAHDASFDLPRRCLLPRGIEGLIMGAGRSISVDPPMLLRVMVHTMVVGQAAGTTAAVAAATGTMPGDVAIPTVQAELHRQGVDLT